MFCVIQNKNRKLATASMSDGDKTSSPQKWEDLLDAADSEIHRLVDPVELAIREELICRICLQLARNSDGLWGEQVTSGNRILEEKLENKSVWWVTCDTCPRMYHLNCLFPGESDVDFCNNRKNFYCQRVGCRFLQDNK